MVSSLEFEENRGDDEHGYTYATRRHRPSNSHTILGVFALSVMFVMYYYSQRSVDPAAADKAYTDAMAREHQHDDPSVINPIYSGNYAVEASVIEYGTDQRGYLALPSNATEASPPAIVVIHEWWGLNHQIQEVTRQLAGMGYVALAVDLYDTQVTSDHNTASQLMSEAYKNKDACIDNMRQAIEYLKTNQTNSSKIGSIGWCFGGTFSLQLALSVPELSACVVYYGIPEENTTALSQLNAPLLGFFGGDDGSIPIPSVERFQSNLESLDKQAEIHIYDGVNHAFANPTGDGYDAEAAADAWEKTTAFLEETLK